MYLCYIDESGVPELSGGTSHFVLLGFVTPVWDWKVQDKAFHDLKATFGLPPDAEIHTGWMARRYLEQERIAGFTAMDWPSRRAAAQRERENTLIRVAARRGRAEVATQIKEYRKSNAYIHLTYSERIACLEKICELIASWQNVKLIAEATDKRAFGGVAPTTPPREEGFQQILSRFNWFLEESGPASYGLIIHDNNDDVSRRLTDLARKYHTQGTMFTQIGRIVETPFFVDSQLTTCVQLADLCAYATRRFFDNGEVNLFDKIFGSFRRSAGKLTGLRHYTGRGHCACKVCREPR